MYPIKNFLVSRYDVLNEEVSMLLETVNIDKLIKKKNGYLNDRMINMKLHRKALKYYYYYYIWQ